MNTDAAESMARDVLDRVNGLQDESATPPATSSSAHTAKVTDYPFADKHPEWIKTATNKVLNDFTLENVLSNEVTAQDTHIIPEALRPQTETAKGVGRDGLAMNFERITELTTIPDDRILEIYNALRPYRSTKDELIVIADDLGNRYQTKICAVFARGTTALYIKRKKPKGDD